MEKKRERQPKNLSLPLEGFARPAQFAYALAVSRTTLYSLMKSDPDFPPPRKDGCRVTLWPVGDVRDYIAKRGGTILPQAHRDNQPIPAS